MKSFLRKAKKKVEEKEDKDELRISSSHMFMGIFSCLLLENSVIDADEGGDGATDEDALVATVDGVVETGNGELREKATEGDTLSVDDVGQQSLGNAEGQGVDNSLGLGASAGAGTLVAVGREVEEVTSDAGDENAGKDPGEGGGPEARGQEQEHVGEMDVVLLGANGSNGGDGKGIAVREDGGTDVVELKGSDGEEDAGDGAQGLAGSVGNLGDARLLVDGGGALAQSDSGAVDGKGDIGGGCRERDAGSDPGEAASGGAEDGARVGPVGYGVSGRQARPV